VETKNISFILVSNNKLLLSHEPLPSIFDYLPSVYSIAYNCGMTRRFWLSDSVVPTFVRTVKHIDISIYLPITNKSPLYQSPSVWTHISADFITKLPLAQGYDSILVIVDRFTKMAHFIPTTEKMSAEGLACITNGYLLVVICKSGLQKAQKCEVV